MNLSTPQTIFQLADKYGDFYVPAFAVKVDGMDLVRELFLTVTNVEVDLQENAAGRFSFTVANAFDWETRAFVSYLDEFRTESLNLIDLFRFGSKVEIRLGYGDPTTLPRLLTGLITEVSTSFSEGSSPELTVSGYDPLYNLMVGKVTQNWEDKRDSEVVRELISVTNLRPEITPTLPEKQRIDKGQESSLAFITKLTENNSKDGRSFIFHVQGEVFYFGPWKEITAVDLELEWGKGLLSFSPEVNLQAQVAKVEVRGFSVEEGEGIIGKAPSVQGESGMRGSSGSRQAQESQPADSTMVIRASVHKQEEADQLAQAILDERGQQFINGNGESIGLPEIVPNINIAIRGLGQPFSQTYHISSAKHSISSSGYKTSWTAKQSRLPPEGQT